ncbi:MAG: hypothetical protein ACTFAL_14760 [Candidatus Electronema sp. V4]|uniref:hypothetical protein n=1 Tax=Candidatus Electronema sp. V4 TaxID=3454756 RepID=UPI0040557CE0
MTVKFLSMASPFVIRRPSYQDRAVLPVPVKPEFKNENVSQKNKELPSLFGKNTTFAYTVKKYFVAERRKNAEWQKREGGG